MKYFVILILIGSISISTMISENSAYGLWLPQSPQELLEESQMIFVGNISSVRILEFERSTSYNTEENGVSKTVIENYTLPLDEYTVNVEESVKNTQIAEVITVRQPTVSMPGRVLPFEGFEVGDRVLFYIKEFDGTNTYSKESFLIPEQCDSFSVITKSRMIGSDYTMMQNGVEKEDNFTANYPIQFIAKSDMGTLSGASLEYDVFISKQVEKIYKERVFNQTITADAKPCEWLSVFEWEFMPDVGNYLLNGRIYENGNSFPIGNKFFSVMAEAPLKQFKSGIAIDEMKCKDNLVLIQKYDGSPACVTLDTKIKLTTRGWVCDDMPILDWKKYITVSASRIDKSELENIAHIVKLEDLPQNDLLQTLLDGADGCKNETEICRISGGISVDRIYPFLTLSISDNDMYSVTLTLNKADDLLSSFDWNDSENLLYSVIQWDEKYYLLILSTFENTRTPDVKMNIVGTTHEPISLERGEILNYTVQVNTWATYGADAQIDLIAVQDAKDSGIDVWIEPNIITVLERSNATATLFIKAQDNANDGIYDIRVIGHANGKLADLYCRNTICPTVNIGNSAWSIRTFGSGTNMGIGGIEYPKNTFLELDLDKKEFLEGDIVEIKTYLINNSTEKIMFVPDRLLIKVIKAQDMGYYDNLYGIDAGYESDELLVLEPYSKTLLVRPFYWNQNTFENFDDEQRVDVRQHKMIAKFVGENYAWNGDTWFEIK